MDNKSKKQTRTTVSSTLGTALEFYDFAIYGLAAGTVFKEVFFIGTTPIVALLASFATFAIGYFARPVGGIILGAIGDRVGRKTILVWTIILMGVASTLIGVLPTYNHIGLWAPALLVVLRITQGIGAGAEMASSSALLVETAPANKRGLIGSLVGIGTNGGTLIAALIWLAVNLLPKEDFISWGWRIPFILSFFIALIGLWMRRNIDESPAFAANAKEQATLTIRENYAHVLTHSKKNVFACIGMRWGENGISTVFLVFLVGQLTQINPDLTGLGSFAILVSAIIALAVVPLAGICSDKFGRKKSFLFLSIFQFIMCFPAIYMIQTGEPLLVIIAFVGCYGIGVMGMYAVQSAYMIELFGAKSRLAAVTSSKEIGALTSGGIAPFICAALIGIYGNLWVIGGYMMLLAFISILSVVFLPETKGRDLITQDDAA